MPKFSYIATNKEKATINGTVEANDRSAALSAIVRQGLIPITVKETRPQTMFTSSLFKGKSVKGDDLVIFTRQLSAMISAGVPLLRALNSLERHSDNKVLKELLTDVIKDVEDGASLAVALGKHPAVFNDVYVNMVQAGEAAGILDEILKRLALQQEKNATIRKKVRSAMTYPTVLIVITILAFFGLMLFVIPQIGNILQDLGGPDAELPLITRIMLSISNAVTGFWYIILPAIIAAVYGTLYYIKTPSGKAKFHKLILQIPGVKGIVTKVVIARFARTFSALMGAGVAVLEAITITAHALGNVVYEKALLDAGETVKNGGSLSGVIEKNPLFPAIVSQMLAVGEETGQTDTVLVKIADFYEEEVDTAIDGISSIIEPVMIVIMGGMVGLIAASVMVPIAGLAQSIQT